MYFYVHACHVILSLHTSHTSPINSSTQSHKFKSHPDNRHQYSRQFRQLHAASDSGAECYRQGFAWTTHSPTYQHCNSHSDTHSRTALGLSSTHTSSQIHTALQAAHSHSHAQPCHTTAQLTTVITVAPHVAILLHTLSTPPCHLPYHTGRRTTLATKPLRGHRAGQAHRQR